MFSLECLEDLGNNEGAFVGENKDLKGRKFFESDLSINLELTKQAQLIGQWVPPAFPWTVAPDYILHGSCVMLRV